MELGACLGSCCGSSGCCGSCLESTSIDFSYNRRRVCNNVMPLLLKKKIISRFHCTSSVSTSRMSFSKPQVLLPFREYHCVHVNQHVKCWYVCLGDISFSTNCQLQYF